MKIVDTVIALAKRVFAFVRQAIEAARSRLPRLRLTPFVNLAASVAGGAVEGVSAAASVAVRAETRKPRAWLAVGLGIGGTLTVLALLAALYLHGYHRGRTEMQAIAVGWETRAHTAEDLASGNAAAAGRAEQAERDLANAVSRRERDKAATDTRYAQALEAARKAACKPSSGKADTSPPGNAPMTRSLRDALGVLRKEESQ